MSPLPTRASRQPLSTSGQRCSTVHAVVAAMAVLVLPAALVPVHAQALPTTAARHHAATDAAQPAPAPAYRNVFAEVPAGVEQGRTDWRSANDEVGRFTRGHIDLLKWEQSQAGQGQGQGQPPGAPASSTPGEQGTHGAPGSHGSRSSRSSHGGHR